MCHGLSLRGHLIDRLPGSQGSPSNRHFIQAVLDWRRRLPAQHGLRKRAVEIITPRSVSRPTKETPFEHAVPRHRQLNKRWALVVVMWASSLDGISRT